MKLKKKLATGLGILTLTSASIFVTALPASATPSPGCIHLYQWQTTFYSKATAKNECPMYQRFRFIWAWAGDSECYGVSPGESRTSSRFGTAPYVSELRAC